MQVAPNYITAQAFIPVGTVVTLETYWGEPIVRAVTDEDCAVMYHPDTRVVADIAHNEFTVESMILEGYVPIPVGKANAARWGTRFKAMVELYDDCYGR